MTARRIAAWFTACFLVAATAAGQGVGPDAFCDTCCEHDLQFFAPVDFDLDCQPIGRDCGYFFRFDKLSWAATGERTRVGTDGIDGGSMNPYRFVQIGAGIVDPDPSDDDDDDLIFTLGTKVELVTPLFLGGLDSTPPSADFAWGERYEIGKFDGENGWLIGVLDGPTVNSNALYGFGYTPQDDTVGGPSPGGIGLPGPVPNNPNNQLLSPLGSVLIVFNDPLNLMIGYLDVLTDPEPDGPPGGALEVDNNGDGVLDGDGIADDINENGQHGPDGFDTQDPAWEPDVRILGVAGDFGDLVRLPTTWQTVSVRNSSETQGIEIMGTHEFSNKHQMQKHQNNLISMNYGVRYLRLRDRFFVDAAGGVLGDSFWHTQVDNNIVGPQLAVNWAHMRHRLRLDTSGRMLFGYNIADFTQDVGLGEDLITGQYNHPLWFQPTVASHGKNENQFSPVVEARVQASYQITGALAAKLGYTATFIDNMYRSSQQVEYTLPRMGLIDGGTQDIFINGVNIGFEAVY